jgi:hypothetical protein
MFGGVKRLQIRHLCGERRLWSQPRSGLRRRESATQQKKPGRTDANVTMSMIHGQRQDASLSASLDLTVHFMNKGPGCVAYSDTTVSGRPKEACPGRGCNDRSPSPNGRWTTDGASGRD